MKTFFSIALLLLFVFPLCAQELEIPEDIKLKTEEDFKNSETLVLKSISWLQETPLNEQTNKRKEVNSFLMKWLTSSPSVSIELVSGFMVDDCPDCLMLFMAGWTQYSLENDYSKDKNACALAGLKSLINFYQSNRKTLGKNRAIEKLIKRNKKGTLEEFVEEQFEG